MKRWVLAGVTIIMAWISPGPVLGTAAGTDKPQQDAALLAAAAAGMYQAVTEGNKQQAYSRLNDMRNLTQKPGIRHKGTERGWRQTSAALQVLEEGLRHGQRLSAAEMRQSAAQLMLAYDALAAEEGEALWVSYAKLLDDDAKRLRLAWAQQTDTHAQAATAALHMLEARIERIAPAAYMQRDEQAVDALRETLRYCRALLAAAERGELDESLMNPLMPALEQAVMRVVSGPQEASAPLVLTPAQAPLPARWATLLAAIILSVLAYAAWRRYAAASAVRRPPPDRPAE
ncbi:hypothetical protein IDH44_08035 [Paenibacillus sp. IB182496]|uniref:Sporulation protein YpjB n=1 Tax=Paenibacillus sabuli TaxID=2772509 RepID=A0A927BTI0_9BACL|nr:sporulation protein YpjB [Paenibacillus sabuli]MBD2845138.1 hypothetical protein [Paenibacillus sabuli]